jgi:hypothetical protein
MLAAWIYVIWLDVVSVAMLLDAVSSTALTVTPGDCI